ncbi:MAG: hypothetical protein R3F43_31940 [bacterium]
MRAYHRLILEPLLEDAPFTMSNWKVHGRARQFMFKNMSMVKLIPPPDLLLYFRVLAGMKGLMTKADVDVNIRRAAEDACRRRGRLPA